MYLIRPAVGKNFRQGTVNGGKTFLMTQQPRRPRLRYQNTARVQPPLGNAVVFLSIEQVRRPPLHRVHQIHHHHIKPFLHLRQIAPGVLMQQSQAGILKTSLMMVRQILPAQPHHFPIQIHHHHPLHTGMAQNLPQSAALAAAANENPRRVGMAQHRRLYQCLVINMLVPLRGLRLAVQYQTAPVKVGLDHFHLLVLRSPRKQCPLYPQHHRQIRIDRLQQPLPRYFLHRRLPPARPGSHRRRLENPPPLDLVHFRIAGLEQFNQRISGVPRLKGIAAGENIGGGIAVLRPSVDGDMRLGNGQDAGHPLRRKAVKGLAHNVRSHILGRPNQGTADIAQVVKELRVTLLEFQQKVQT